MMRALVVYYSHSGNTKRIADMIQKKMGADLLEIKPVVPYPVSYDEVVEQAKKEIRAGFVPEIQKTDVDLSKYDTIFVGTPNWWSTIAPPVAAFLKEQDLTGKTVAVFCTHGGGGLGRVKSDVEKLCPESRVMKCFETYGNGGGRAEQLVDEWLGKLGA